MVFHGSISHSCKWENKWSGMENTLSKVIKENEIVNISFCLMDEMALGIKVRCVITRDVNTKTPILSGNVTGRKSCSGKSGINVVLLHLTVDK